MKSKHVFSLVFSFIILITKSQNPNIKCYFNHPVNTAVSSGVNAMYNTSFKDTLIGYINRSKYTLDFCIYNYTYYSSDGFNAIATAVNNAYARGVVVRWIYDGSSTNSGLPLLNTNIKKLGSPTSTGYGISHNKFVVIDANSSNVNDAFVWTGSFNFSQTQNTSDYNNVIIFQDKPLAQAYYNEFNKMWGGTGSAPNLTNSKFGTNKSASTQTSFTVNGTPVQVYFSPMDNATSHLQNAVNTANSDLYFGIYTFTDNNIANSIKNKILSGVFSKGIEDQFSQSYSPYTTLSSTMSSNLKIYSGSALYHNKFLIVDPSNVSSDPIVETGSYNWSLSGTNNNDENMVIVHDAVVANQFYQSFCKNFVDVGGVACSAVTGLEKGGIENEEFVVYPNPSSDFVKIILKSEEPAKEIKIINALGQVCYSENNIALNYLILNIENYKSGIYFILLKTKDKLSIQKLIKQ